MSGTHAAYDRRPTPGTGSRLEWLDCDAHPRGVGLSLRALGLRIRPVSVPGARRPDQQGDLIQRHRLAAGTLTDDVIRLGQPDTITSSTDVTALPPTTKEPPPTEVGGGSSLVPGSGWLRHPDVPAVALLFPPERDQHGDVHQRGGRVDGEPDDLSERVVVVNVNPH